MTDPIQSAIQVAIDGLADRQHVTNNNLANIQTPGYIAGQTDFESNLQAALNGDTSANLTPEHMQSTAPTNVNGNNVDLDNETVTATDTELRYEAMIQAMNVKFQLLKGAMGSN